MKELVIFLTFCHVSLAALQCCDPGLLIVNRGLCGDESTRPYLNCTDGRWLLKEYILEGTKLYAKDTGHFVFAEDPDKYCVGKVHMNFSDPRSEIVPAALVCADPPADSTETTGVLTLISVVFLVLTLGFYMFLPGMRDLQGLCYISMCVSMALAYLSLGVLQLSRDFTGEICTVTGFVVYFWMMATFFWMNVISINTYRSIKDATYLRKSERQQFFLYSCYAWGWTFFFLIVTLATNFAEGNHWRPGIGDNSCWFQGATETWIFFYGPVAILITCNIVLFIISSTLLWQQSSQYEVDKLNNLKHKFLLSLKLFLVMGISWIFEIASFAHGKSTVLWKITDTFNCLQGVVIFILLVLLRRRAIRGLVNENCCLAVTVPLAEKLSPYDDEDDRQALSDDTQEVRLN